MLKLEFYELALTLLCIAEVRNTEVLLLKGGISKQEQEQWRSDNANFLKIWHVGTIFKHVSVILRHHG